MIRDPHVPSPTNPAAWLDWEWSGTALRLHPDRGLHWPAGNTLFIADTHFGKSAGMRRFGIAAPEDIDRELARLEGMLATAAAGRLVVLGDLWHGRAGRTDAVVDALARWRHRQAGLEIVLVRGNHDRAAGDPPPELGIRCVEEPWRLGPFACCHQPVPCPGERVLAGHLHPGVRLTDRAGGSLRCPVFAFRATTGVLPAFGRFTGLQLVAPGEDSAIFLVGEDRVLPWPGSLSRR